MENRELTLDDYLAMFRRRMKVILIPALLAPLAGFLVSYLFSAKYTSQSEVLVESPKISDAVVPQVYNEDLTQQMNEIVGRVMSTTTLRPRVEALGLAGQARTVDDLVGNIQQNMTIQQAPDISQETPGKKEAERFGLVLRELYRVERRGGKTDLLRVDFDADRTGSQIEAGAYQGHHRFPYATGGRREGASRRPR